MDVTRLAYLVSFSVPVLLMVVSCVSRKVIEGSSWHRKHFYLGIDLTIYFLAVCLVNVADLAKGPNGGDPRAYIWTVVLLSVATMTLWVQVAFHQEWEKDTKGAKGQIIVLCLASNGVGLFLLLGFIRMKLGGLL